jgi:hypothetical protein
LEEFVQGFLPPKRESHCWVILFTPGFVEGFLQPVRQQQQRQPVFFAIKRKPLIVLATQMSTSVRRCEPLILEEKWTSRIITKTEKVAF